MLHYFDKHCVRLTSVVLFVALTVGAQAQLLYNQAPHTPGAAGPPAGNGISNFTNFSTEDREIVDDFTVTGLGWVINQVDITGVWDSVPFTKDPAGGFEVAFFSKNGNQPDPNAIAPQISTNFVGSMTGVSYIFGGGQYESRHWLIDINPVTLLPGDYYVMIQPIDGQNFFQLTSTPTYPIYGTPMFLRSGTPGGPYPPGPSWTPGIAVIGDNHDLAFSLHGTQVVPEPGTILVLMAGVGAALRRRCDRSKLVRAQHGANFKGLLSTKGVMMGAAAIGLAASPIDARAEWLVWTSGNSMSQSGLFPTSAGPAYWGTAQATVSGFYDGGGIGTAGLSQIAHSNLTPSFYSHYSTNASGAMHALGITYDHTRDRYRVTIDFGNMALGRIIAGTTMAVLDLDIEEEMLNVRAWDPFGNQITSSWLSQYPGNKGLLDYSLDQDGLDITGAIASPIVLGGSTGIYNFKGWWWNDTSSLLGFATTVDVGRIVFDFAKSSTTDYNHIGGYGVAFASPVPEPTSAAIFAVGTAVSAALRVRRRK